MSARALQPTLTLADAFGPGHVYAPRAHPDTAEWFYPDAALLDALTANQFTIVGATPVVCSTGVTSAAGLELLAMAGLPVPQATIEYTDPMSAFDVVVQAARGGARVVVQHLYPRGVLPDGALWVEPRLLSYLNNKANLAQLVPADRVPARSLRAAHDVFGGADPVKPPVVLKVATDHSTAGGLAVAVCRTSDDLAAAADRFGRCGRLVVEQPLRIVRNPCLHYAVLPDGTARYFGYADQDVTEAGRYRGNWLNVGERLDPTIAELGLTIARRAAAMGYHGIVGIDAAIVEDGRALLIDLNFRINGSTAAALLEPAIRRAYGDVVMHLRTFLCADGYNRLIRAARPAVTSGRLLPLGSFDPVAAGYLGQPARLAGLVLGGSRRDCEAIEAELHANGLV